METIMAEAEYVGGLRTKAIHLRSGKAITTDAPVDNNGKGETFSPTDLVSAALSSCMMTIMGIVAEREGVNLTGLKSEVVKVMNSTPRKISEIKIHFTYPGLLASEEQKQKLKNAARTCPVALSLSSDLKQTISFDF